MTPTGKLQRASSTTYGAGFFESHSDLDHSVATVNTLNYGEPSGSSSNTTLGVVSCNTPRLRGQEVDGASAQTERYRGSWTPAKSLQIPPDVNTTQSIE